MKTIALGACVLGMLAGCAGYSITENGTGTGYDVYQPEPYLLRQPITASSGTITGYQFNLIWLPNYSKRYRVRSWAGMGAADFQFTFTDGWKLTGLQDKSNNTEVLKQLVGLAEHLIPANPLQLGEKRGNVAGGGERGIDKDVEESKRPVLYKIELQDGCGPKLIAVCGDPCAWEKAALEVNEKERLELKERDQKDWEKRFKQPPQ
jgi:hypothetical protein